MFPIGDDNSDRTITPLVNYAFIGINILVFLLLQQIGSNDAFSYAFSLVPKEITTGIDITGVQVVRDSFGNTGEVQHYATPLPVYFNFLSSMFMHGDINKALEKLQLHKSINCAKVVSVAYVTHQIRIFYDKNAMATNWSKPRKPLNKPLRYISSLNLSSCRFSEFFAIF